jgi:hypothetical protein
MGGVEKAVALVLTCIDDDADCDGMSISMHG